MSNPFDRLLVNPDEKTLVLALEEAGGQDFMALWQFGPRHWAAILAKMADAAEEQVQLSADNLYLLVAWWTDHQGRRHVRICSGDSASDHHLHSSRMDEDLRPPLWHVYPERTFRVHRPGQAPAWLASCACGVTGLPQELAWMGPCCGPCHDRREEGEAEPFANRPVILIPGGGQIQALALSPDGGTVAASASPLQLLLFELGNGGRTCLEGPDETGEGDEFRPIVYSPEGEMLAVGEPENKVVVWRLDRPEKAAVVLALDWAPIEVQVKCLAFSPNGRLLAVCSADGHLRVWQCQEEDWRAVHRRQNGVVHACFSPDGQTLAIGHRKPFVSLLRTDVWYERRRIHTRAEENHEILFLEYTPDGASIVLITGRTNGVWVVEGTEELIGETKTYQLRLWDLAHDREVLRADIPGPSIVALSPDGCFLAGIVHDFQHSPAEILFWDLRTMQEAGRLQWNPEDDLRALAFSPDNHTLAAGSNQGIIKLIPWRVLLEG